MMTVNYRCDKEERLSGGRSSRSVLLSIYTHLAPIIARDCHRAPSLHACSSTVTKIVYMMETNERQEQTS